MSADPLEGRERARLDPELEAREAERCRIEGCDPPHFPRTPAAPETAPRSNELIQQTAARLVEELKPLYCSMSPIPLEQVRSLIIGAFLEIAEDEYRQAYEFISGLKSSAESVACPTCDGERVVMTAPPGAGHSDDLAEYDPCPDCKGTGVAGTTAKEK